ncbi:hypothetical protein R3X28_16255 [Maribacter sp. TH_r10]|uniref:hypothetical protein n=1 Tax=Maribacter sp. TH_r10 TaxID=3082086 RepID=UPI0029553C0E|nr:hypothetical protein [Maribacter sp. TH_r10]MDV7140446.1 hypothetical protein [Maribacter sp. TH_r10]
MEKKKRPIIKKIVIMYGSILLIFFISVIYMSRNNGKDADYYKEVNLKMNGIITDIKPLNVYGHDYGVIDINISESNISDYDIRQEQDRYLGVIKASKASLVFGAVSQVKTGDSIVLNIQNYSIYRNKRIIRESTIGMPPKSFLFRPFNEINRKIKL